MTNVPFVSVIIPVLNDPTRLKACLQALEQQTYPADQYEVIVVDNGSDEPIDFVVRTFPHAQATFEAQRSIHAARQHGIALAKGEIVVFTDADCVPEPDWIEKGVNVLLQNPDCGLVGGKIIVFVRDPHHMTPAEIYEKLTAFPQQGYIEHDHFGATANVFTWRRVIDHVGGLRLDLQSGGDREWGQRVFAAGYKLLYADEVVVYHPARSSVKELSIKAIRVMRGIHALKIFPVSPKQVLRDFIPPLRNMLAVFRDHQISGWKLKTQVALLFLYMKYLRGWWRIRLWWHDRAGRHITGPRSSDGQ